MACSPVDVGHLGHVVDGGLAWFGACHFGGVCCCQSSESYELKQCARSLGFGTYETVRVVNPESLMNRVKLRWQYRWIDLCQLWVPEYRLPYVRSM